MALAVITGGVLSMLMGENVTGAALFPALSVQTPVLVTDWLAPSVVTVAPASVLVAIPEIEAVQVKATVTFWLVHVPDV